MRRSVEKDNRLYFDRIAKGLFVGVALFALIGGFFAFPAYGPIVLTALGLGLAFKAVGTPPATNTRSFLYLMGAVAAMAITATLLTLFPSVGLVIGLTAFLVASGSIATRFLESKHSLATELPFLSRGSYVLAGLAFLGLAIGFSLMATGVLPTFILLPVFLSCSLGAAALTSVVTLCTPVKAAAYAPVSEADHHGDHAGVRFVAGATGVSGAHVATPATGLFPGLEQAAGEARNSYPLVDPDDPRRTASGAFVPT